MIIPKSWTTEGMIQGAIQLLEAENEVAPCRENELALAELDASLMLLNARNLREGDGTLADQVIPS